MVPKTRSRTHAPFRHAARPELAHESNGRRDLITDFGTAQNYASRGPKSRLHPVLHPWVRGRHAIGAGTFVLRHERPGAHPAHASSAVVHADSTAVWSERTEGDRAGTAASVGLHERCASGASSECAARFGRAEHTTAAIVDASRACARARSVGRFSRRDGCPRRRRQPPGRGGVR